MAKTNIKNEVRATPEPRFFISQLIGCKQLNVSPDVIRAVLNAEKAYTIGEAKAAINDFLTRKV